jgi:beta-glucosidase
MKKKICYSLSWLILLLPVATFGANNKPAYLDNQLSVAKRVNDLLKRMTLEEKLGQMHQSQIVHFDQEIVDEIKKGRIGSILGYRDAVLDANSRDAFQRAAVQEARLHIPLIFGQDVIHGCCTIFPIGLAQSCSWSPELVEKVSRIAAIEAADRGINWTFAPMVDIARDPRWGRISEGFGEDTYLCSAMAAAAVRGFQGKQFSAPDSIAACLKHYAGYGAAMGGRDYQYTEISERTLREVYLPPFRAGVQAGALTLMSAFNDISGIPASGNSFTLDKVLRKQWGFDGFVVSDWNSVDELQWHGFAASQAEAAQKAVTAGVDMEMVSPTYWTLEEQVTTGKISGKVIDEAVRRILTIKFRLGLFEHPYINAAMRKKELSEEYIETAREAARQCMVLLKNSNSVLPVKNAESIAVVGPWAKSHDVLGWWKSLGRYSDVVTIYDGISKNAPKDVEVTDSIKANTDLVVLCVGEANDLIGEDHSRSSLKLPGNQEQLVIDTVKHGKPVVLVVCNGRPLDLSNINDKIGAILIAWHGGTQAGNAVADIIFGKYNPSGKLTTSWPRFVGQVPVYYNHRNSGRPRHNRYVDLTAEPLYPFGYGLSFTTFDYSNLKLSASTIKDFKSVVVSTDVTNTGSTAGYEVVQLYIQDVAASVTRPVKELRGFQKVWLEAGQKKTVTFTLTPNELAILDANMKTVVEPGKFNLWIAPDSKTGMMASIEILKEVLLTN